MFWDEIEEFLKAMNCPDFNFDGKVDLSDYLLYSDYLDELENEANETDEDDEDEEFDLLDMDEEDCEDDIEYDSDDEDDSEVFDYHETNNATHSKPYARSVKKDTGIWRYYSSDWRDWNYDQALIENFPELAEDYEPNISDSTLPDIIIETYEIDQDRAVQYLKWLWKTFTPSLFTNEKDTPGFETESYKGRGNLIGRMILEFGDSDSLYNLLKSDSDFIFAAFRDCKHQKHDYWLAKSYMSFMLNHNDVVSAKMVYYCYLEGQKGRYSDKDLGNLWSEIIDEIHWLEIDGKDKAKMAEALVPFIEKIGVRGKTPLETLAGYQKEWVEEDESPDDEYDDDEMTEDDSEYDCYSWRKTVAPSKLRFADPYEYETAEEFEKAVSIAYTKCEEEKVNARRAGYTNDNICAFCKVDITSSPGIPLYYFTGDLDLSVGDTVTVPLGSSNVPVQGIVVSVGKCYASSFTFDIKKIKTVIEKKVY